MKRTARVSLVAAVFALAAAAGCKKVEEGAPSAKSTSGAEPATPTLKADKGVDVAKKVIRIGMLNDESGPGAGIGKPYAVGKRVLAAQINAGGSGLLPEGWTVELVEKDHGYSPQKSVEHYNAIKEDVLFIGTSFGTPNTKPLIDSLKGDKMVAFPASLESEMAEHENTPPFGPSYKIEAMRAMDFIVEKTGDAAKVKAAVVYQSDDYGKDGLNGFKAAADKLGIKLVAEEAIAPAQADFTTIVKTLKAKGAEYVLIMALPKQTAGILGTSDAMGYKPVYIGNTPSWVDVYFSDKVLPPKYLENFYWVTGLTYWNEEVPGMKAFVAAFDKLKPEGATPNFYTMASYAQGLAAIEAAKRAIEANDITRAGYLAALHQVAGWYGNGLFKAISIKAVPYTVSTKTRILKPVLDKGTWEQVSPYADPKSL